MKIIKPEDAPISPTKRQGHGQFRPIYDAVVNGNAVELVYGEDYTDEGKTRNSVSLSMKRWGLPVTIRKDPKTNSLFVFSKESEVSDVPTKSETGDVPLTSVVDEWGWRDDKA